MQLSVIYMCLPFGSRGVLPLSRFYSQRIVSSVSREFSRLDAQLPNFVNIIIEHRNFFSNWKRSAHQIEIYIDKLLSAGINMAAGHK